MSKSPDFGPRGMDISEARGGVDVPKLPGTYGRSERRVPPATPHRRKLTRGQKAWIWGTGITLAAGAALGIGINKAVNQEPEQNPVDTTAITTPTTIPENVTIPPITTTTTEKPTTTTTEKPTTTTTEKLTTTTTTENQRNKIIKNIEDLFSSEKVSSDVTGKIPVATDLEPSASVYGDKELNDAYGKKNPSNVILYVGDKNKGKKANAIISTKFYRPEALGGDKGYDFSFFGGMAKEGAANGATTVVMEFKDVIKVDDNSGDFYIRGVNPLTEEEIYARVNLSKNTSRNQYTTLWCFDYNKFIQETGDKFMYSHTALNVLKNYKLSDFMNSGDTVFMIMSYVNMIDFETRKATVAFEKDDRDVQFVREIIVGRLEGAEEINKLFETTVGK